MVMKERRAMQREKVEGKMIFVVAIGASIVGILDFTVHSI